MLQTTSTERRAAGGDRPRSGASVEMRPGLVRSRPPGTLADRHQIASSLEMVNPGLQ